MPQVFQVLRCFSCQTFQVHQVKKAKKWSCKMCGEKQSLIKVYCRGTGAECRHHTQRLNQLQGEVAEIVGTTPSTSQCEEIDSNTDTDAHSQNNEPVQTSAVPGRWCQYLEPEEDDPVSAVDDGVYTTDWSRYKAARNQAKRSAAESINSNKRPRKNSFESVPKKNYQPFTRKEESLSDEQLATCAMSGQERVNFGVASKPGFRNWIMPPFCSGIQNEEQSTSWKPDSNSLQCRLGNSGRVPYGPTRVSEAKVTCDSFKSFPVRTARPNLSNVTNSLEKLGSKNDKSSTESVVKPGSKWGKFFVIEGENNDSSEEIDDCLSQPVVEEQYVLRANQMPTYVQDADHLKSKDSKNVLSTEKLFSLDSSDEENLINFDI